MANCKGGISWKLHFSKYMCIYICVALSYNVKDVAFLCVTLKKVWKTDLGQYNMLPAA